jgi:hypothetical protein
MDQVKLSETEVRRRRQKNWAVAALILAFVAFFYVVTMVKMSGGAS